MTLLLEGDEDIEGDGMLLATRNQKLCIPEYGHRIQLVNWLVLIDKPRAPITVLRDRHALQRTEPNTHEAANSYLVLLKSLSGWLAHVYIPSECLHYVFLYANRGQIRYIQCIK